MNSMITRIRPLIYAASAVWALAVFAYVITQFGTNDLIKIRLVQIYALTAIVFLYKALLITPFYGAFPNFPGKVLAVKARKAIGICAFWFGSLHGLLAFFGTLGGFAGLGFLSTKFLLGIGLSSFALLLLTIMAITSIRRLTHRYNIPWRVIHKIVYVAGVLVLIHALMLGTHYIDLHSTIAVITFILVAFLVLLQANRIDNYLEKTMPPWPRVGVVTVAILVIVVLGAFRIYGPQGSSVSLGIHAAHLAQVQNQNSNQAAGTDYTGKRYTVSVNPLAASAKKDTPVTIAIYDADTGNQVTNFSRTHEELMHLIVVDSSLAYYNHIHPTLANGVFGINLNFPSDGVYRLYMEFFPTGGTEQHFAVTMPVGNNPQAAPSVQRVDTNNTKTADALRVTATPTSGNSFSIADFQSSKQVLNFHITESDGSPVKNIEPYLGAFGHLVMIKQDTYQYVHVHPLPSNDVSFAGPDIQFAPLAFANFKPLEPGIYRAFAQFKRNGKIMTVDFTWELKP